MLEAEISPASVSRYNMSRSSGTVSVSKNSVQVIGSQTYFSNDYISGDTIRIGNNTVYFLSKVDSITDNTHLTISKSPSYDISSNVHFNVNTFIATITVTSDVPGENVDDITSWTVAEGQIAQNNISIESNGDTLTISGYYNDPFSDEFIWRPRAISANVTGTASTWHDLPLDEIYYDLNQLSGLDSANIEFTLITDISDSNGAVSSDSITINHVVTNSSDDFGNMITSYYKGYD